MNEAEQLDFIQVLKKIFDAFKKKDIKKLRILSDHIINDASIFQDEYAISLAIIIYTLSKILEKGHYENHPGWSSFFKNSTNKIKKLSTYLGKSDFEKYSATLRELLGEIRNMDKKVPLYIEELLNSSKIKKGGSLYDYGLSLGRATELLGISKWELMSYVGNLNIKNESPKTIGIKERYYNAKRVFNLR